MDKKYGIYSRFLFIFCFKQILKRYNQQHHFLLISGTIFSIHTCITTPMKYQLLKKLVPGLFVYLFLYFDYWLPLTPYPIYDLQHCNDNCLGLFVMSLFMYYLYKGYSTTKDKVVVFFLFLLQVELRVERFRRMTCYRIPWRAS